MTKFPAASRQRGPPTGKTTRFRSCSGERRAGFGCYNDVAISPRSRFWVSFLAPFALIAIAGAILLAALRESTEPLTPESLEAAEALWRANGPRSYRLDVEIGGAQEGRHDIRVREGRVEAMTTDGRPVPESAWDHWSVEGMFRQLRQELAMARDPRKPHGAADPASILLRVRFDRDLGAPRYFLRHVSGRATGAWWRILALEPSAHPQ